MCPWVRKSEQTRKFLQVRTVNFLREHPMISFTAHALYSNIDWGQRNEPKPITISRLISASEKSFKDGDVVINQCQPQEFMFVPKKKMYEEGWRLIRKKNGYFIIQHKDTKEEKFILKEEWI